MQPSVLGPCRKPEVSDDESGFTLIELLIGVLIMLIVTSGVLMFVISMYASSSNSSARTDETAEAHKIAQALSTYFISAQCVGGSGNVSSSQVKTTLAGITPSPPPTIAYSGYSCTASNSSAASAGSGGPNILVQGSSTAFEFFAPDPPNGCTNFSTCKYSLYYVEYLPESTYINAGTTSTLSTTGSCVASGSFTGCGHLIVEDLTNGYETDLGNYVLSGSLSFSYYANFTCSNSGTPATSVGTNNNVQSVSMTMTFQESASSPAVPFTTCLYFADATQ